MEESQNAVDDPVLFQQVLPRQCAQKKIHPHGQDEYQNNEAGLIYIFFRKNHSQRVCEYKAEQCAYEGKQQRKAESLQVLGRCNLCQIQ